MSEAFSISGHCLCGAVSFTATAKSHDVTACHCSMCNRWAGGISLFLEAAGAPVMNGGENLAFYRSSDIGERAFCKVCGSSLYWKAIGKDIYHLSAGAINEQSSLNLTTEIFVDDKPAFYEFANDTVKQTGEEVIAAFLAGKG